MRSLWRIWLCRRTSYSTGLSFRRNRTVCGLPPWTDGDTWRQDYVANPQDQRDGSAERDSAEGIRVSKVSVGQKYGRLLVVALIPHKKNPKASCLCDCGKFVTPQRGALINGRASSCGCMRAEKLAAHIDMIRLPESERKRRKRECAKRWASQNYHKIREINRRAVNKHHSKYPEKARENCRNRRARIAGATGNVSRGIDAILMKMQRNRCACCKANISSVGFHLDHIVPLSHGGLHDDSNFQLLCPSCNLSKGAKTSEEFMQKKGYLL